MPVNKSIEKALSLLEDDKSKALGLTVGKHTNVQTGQYIPRADAQSPPELSFTSLSPEKTYLVVGLDIDAPFPSFSVLGPILHWIQPGFKPTPLADGGFSLNSTDPFVVNYIGPAPPPGSSPHRYSFFLYEQPADFDGKKHAPPGSKKLPNMQRMRYDLDGWEKAAKLGPVLAFNYFKSN